MSSTSTSTNPSYSPWLQAACVVGTGLFAGTALGVSCAEHPSRLDCAKSPEFMLAQWRQSFRRAALMQASLAFTSCATGLLSWYLSPDNKPLSNVWLTSSLTIGSVIPFTLAFIAPTNSYLLNASSAANGILPALQQWGKLHAVRTVASILAFLGLVSEFFR